MNPFCFCIFIISVHKHIMSFYNFFCSRPLFFFFLQICNAVAVAGFLNATLVIPNFHYHSIWRDPRSLSLSPPLSLTKLNFF